MLALGRIMTDIDELNTLLREVRRAKKAIDQIERRLTTMLTESRDEAYTENRDSDIRKQDVVEIASGASARRRHAKVVVDIIRELEREDGAANLDKIVQRAADVAIRQETANREIARLLNEGAIYEPVKRSGKDRLKH